MTSFKRVAPHPSSLSLQLNRQNAPLVSPFSTMTSHGRGGLRMEEAEESYAVDPADEAQFSDPAYEAQFFEIGRDERDEREELAEPATHSEKKGKKTWKRKRSNSSSSGGIDPNDTTVYPTTSELAHKILRKTWGFDEFRPRQEEAISRLIHGGSAVTVFPTGGGKSLVFQIPALALDEYDESMGRKKGGISIVVSPLLALMKVCDLRS